MVTDKDSASRHRVQLNNSALIIGCGMIGLALLQTARLAGYGHIVAVDTAPDRLQQARDLGADDTVNTAGDRALDALLARTGGRGFDHVFEAVGVAATVDLALRELLEASTLGELATKVEAHTGSTRAEIGLMDALLAEAEEAR